MAETLVAPRSDDEIGPIAKAFNQLLDPFASRDELERSMRTLTERTDQLGARNTEPTRLSSAGTTSSPP